MESTDAGSYQPFSSLRSNVIYAQPRGKWSRGEMELTDGISCFGLHSAHGQDSTVQTADRTWYFTKEGFWRTRIVVTDARDGGSIAATLHYPTLTKPGELHISDGKSFFVQKRSFWKSQYIWTTVQQDELLEIHPLPGPWPSTRIMLTLKNMMFDDIYLPLLVFLSVQIALYERESSSG